MTYKNANTSNENNEIIISCTYNGYHNKLCILDAAKFPQDGIALTLDEDDFTYKYISCRVSAIDYSAARNMYIVGVTGHLRYWVEHNKWYYQNSDGSVRGWYKQGCEPSGYVKVTYEDGQRVSGTAYAGGHIQMYAKWDEYYVFYDSNEAIINDKSIKNMQIARFLKGKTNLIEKYDSDSLNSANIYNFTFLGYTLYRKEIEKWYYISADGATRAWYTEGAQPAGYTKYMVTFSDTGTAYLGGTALPGERLVLYAAWNKTSKS